VDNPRCCCRLGSGDISVWKRLFMLMFGGILEWNLGTSFITSFSLRRLCLGWSEGNNPRIDLQGRTYKDFLLAVHCPLLRKRGKKRSWCPTGFACLQAILFSRKKSIREVEDWFLTLTCHLTGWLTPRIIVQWVPVKTYSISEWSHRRRHESWSDDQELDRYDSSYRSGPH
jgi:hypothetical protein